MNQQERIQYRVVVTAGALLLALAAATWATESAQLGQAVFVGALAGVGLYHAAFGFTAGWRRFIRERRGAGLRAQCWLLGATTLFAIPIIVYGDALGVAAGGFVFPFGIAVAIGAFMFGVGMQLGGGCGSGTLFTVGGGSTRMVVTLAFFILGGLLATAHWDFWQSLPALPAVSLSTVASPSGAILLTAALLALIAWLTMRLERRQHGTLGPGRPMGSVLRGPWSMAAGIIVLTAVGVLTLLVLGRPWGITSGLTLWGAQIANLVGVPIDTWPYWTYAMDQVTASPLASGTGVMNFGLIIGACLAAGLAGRFSPARTLSTRDVLTAMIGGLLMGYGARIAFGCNIGALLGGIASGSLHGWGWFAFAFVGSMLGVRLRAITGMDPPLARQPTLATSST